MKNKQILILLMIALLSSLRAKAVSLSPQELGRNEGSRIISDLQKPLAPGEKGVRILTDGQTETPDPARPIPVTLPNGEKKFLVGLSGQHIILVDSLSDLAKGGLQKLVQVDLYNEEGHPYGGELHSGTGLPLGYALDSSTWDITVSHAKDVGGEGTHMVVMAGAMGNDRDGFPQVIGAAMTSRRRVFFHDVKFEMQPDGSYHLVARHPRSPLTKSLPKSFNWVIKDAKGQFIFNHGYGGEPVTLPSGELYVDSRGWVPVIHESVWEQRLLPDRKGRMKRAPYRTVLAVTYMDPTLTKVMRVAKPVLDVYKPDGAIWAAAERPGLGPLVEGAHVEVQYQGKAVRTMREVEAIRDSGGALDFQMLLSAGEYYSRYGSFMAMAKGNPDSFTPVTDPQGELLDVTAQLKPLFTWLGRPVSFQDENGHEYLLVHGVARSDVPEGIELDTKITKKEHWKFFNRRLIVVPIERYQESGTPRIRLVDSTGLLARLENRSPRTGRSTPKESKMKRSSHMCRAVLAG